MRIAFTGAHRTGKTTLIEALIERLPGYLWVTEPYHLMAEDGYAFCHPPSLDDFEAQLERSIGCLAEGDPNVLFDRCPLDILAYLLTHENGSAFVVAEWMERVRSAVDTLDLVVYVPIEEVDRIPYSTSDDDGNRASIDERLRDLVYGDALDLGVDVIEVEGDLPTRARRVLRQIEAR